jgi:predicted transcriptional regulator
MEKKLSMITVRVPETLKKEIEILAEIERAKNCDSIKVASICRRFIIAGLQQQRNQCHSLKATRKTA